MRTRALTAFFLLISASLYAQPCREVIAYYPNWQWYDRNKLVRPATIDYDQYSIINYAFFKPEATGMISSTDTWADENLLLGQPDWQNGGYLPNTSMVDLAHNHGVKVLASIGGWTLSNNFPLLAADPPAREQFASSCVNLITTYGLDGIDIDWEYPGFAAHNGTPNDGTNFTLLMRTVRDSLNVLSQGSGMSYLLTSCFSPDPAKMGIIEWNNLDSLLDFFNLMTYDFFGPWDSISNHNSPLYSPAQGDTSFNIDAAFRNVSQQYGIDPGKVNIGLAFYGRSLINCTSLHGPSGQSPDMATFWEDEGNPLYYNVLNRMSLFSYHWDPLANVPYLLGNNINTFVSFDDARSIADKAQYVIDHNAAGVIIWELTGDYIEAAIPGQVAGTPLADTVNAVLCGTTTARKQQTDIPLVQSIAPNPQKASQPVLLHYLVTEKCIVSISIYDMLGRCVNRVDMTAKPPGEHHWEFSCAVPGIYHVLLRAGKMNAVVPVIFQP